MKKRSFSLVHLTNIQCPPPEMIRVAARCGYDAVSLRTIPMGLPGERPYDVARDPQLLRETRAAAQETGVCIHDTENARIADGIRVEDYEPCLAAAAELGIGHILTNIWTPDRSFYTDQFGRLCQLAAQYSQTVSVEFVTWASVTDLAQARQLLLDSGQRNVGVVVDCLHFYRSRVSLDQLRACPKEWFHYAHLCDCPAPIPTAEAALVHTGRSERLYPGEGAIPIREILDLMPDAVCGVEVPHAKRLETVGYDTHAKRALAAAKAVLIQEMHTRE